MQGGSLFEIWEALFCCSCFQIYIFSFPLDTFSQISSLKDQKNKTRDLVLLGEYCIFCGDELEDFFLFAAFGIDVYDKLAVFMSPFELIAEHFSFGF